MLDHLSYSNYKNNAILFGILILTVAWPWLATELQALHCKSGSDLM